MQLGMIGLGRMGSGLVRRLMDHDHACVVYDRDPALVDALAAGGAHGVSSIAEMVAALAPPRIVWVMIPAGVTGLVIEEAADSLDAGDVVIDGGNSYYRDDLTRAAALEALGVHLVDVGTSGGVHGEGRGFCLMVGGEPDVVTRLAPIFDALAPGVDSAPRTAARRGDVATEEHGWLHCGPNGAGHFVKMVHNGIEYGMMAAFAEGLAILERADVGTVPRSADAETAPLREPAAYAYDLDVAAITEVWRRGSVISSWLVDLAADALHRSPQLAELEGHVSDSGEGRWTIQAAVDEGVPAPVLSASLFSRFASRGNDDFTNRVLSALRREFGGHAEQLGP